MLRYILDTHPAVYCPPELFLGNAAFGWVTFLAGLNGKVVEKKDASAPQFQEILAQTRGLIAGQMFLHTSRRGKRLWCEKTPNNMEHLALLDALFPQARYLCLYRHCLDVVKSGMDMSDRIEALLPFLYASRGHLVTALIRYWTDWNRKLLQFEAEHPGRCHRLRYEPLVSEPTPALADLFSFLGLDWEERLLDSVFSSQHDEGVEDPKVRLAKSIHRGSIGAGCSVSLAGVPEKVLDGMRQVLDELGYAPAPQRDGEPLGARGQQDAREPAGRPNVAWLFETHLRGLLQAEPQLAREIGVSCQFAISGEGGGGWTVEPGQSGAKVLTGTHPATCTIRMSSADLLDLVGGRLMPLAALREGRIRLEGALNSESLLSLLGLLWQKPSGR